MKRIIYRISVALTVLLVLGLVAHYAAAASKFSDWSAPVNLGAPVNSAFNDFGQAVSKNGLSLYLTSDRPGGFGDTDIWVSQRASVRDAWGPPVNLGTSVNTSALHAKRCAKASRHSCRLDSWSTARKLAKKCCLPGAA